MESFRIVDFLSPVAPAGFMTADVRANVRAAMSLLLVQHARGARKYKRILFKFSKKSAFCAGDDGESTFRERDWKSFSRRK